MKKTFITLVFMMLTFQVTAGADKKRVFKQFKCESTRNCTSDVDDGQSRVHCQPESLKKHSTKIPAIINIILIIIIGGLGNLLTLISIAHARLR